jgi:tetratricopeptide (TPR) repeat protein
LTGAGNLDGLLLEYPALRQGAVAEEGPQIAYAQARLGNFAAAERTIALTPASCSPCLRIRAKIAELRGQRDRADQWFARAVAVAPSIPFAYSERGRVLLERGQADAAIAQFKIANQKGPHFADPLEGWGEALMAKNQSHRALAKFVQAEKYAPNWGRLHLKWAEALFYSGKRDEARAQFARAAALDLTSFEKSELARMNAHV